jgi:hypothetical protein
MGKLTWRGPVPKDDPMFSTGPELFSPLASSELEKSSVTGTVEATPVTTSAVTEDDARVGLKLETPRSSSRLTPSEIESLRQEAKASQVAMRAMLKK